MLADTALSLGADTGSPDPSLLGTYGSLLCTAAQHDHRSRSLQLIGEAEETTRRLGGAIRHYTAFSATNVTIYPIGVRTALGDAGTALDYARCIEIHSLPTAEHLAPEDLRRPSVRSRVTGLLHAPGPTPAGLREFATQIGATG